MNALSVLMPCLNEANTLARCISSARLALAQAGITHSEIIIADNGSTDDSVAIATAAGARVVHVTTKGYGAALHAGILAAQYEWIIFADADESYDFADVPQFIPAMRSGADLVVGNRFAGGIDAGAMPLLHRYLGTPVISWIGRQSFAVSLGDFNCGMRAIRKAAYEQLHMQSPGMEFASEMIAKAGLQRMHIAEVPVRLHKDGRDRKPHLKTWQDGWKHLRLMLLLSPKWLLLAPAIFFLMLGLLLSSTLLFSYIQVFNLVLDIHTLYYASIFVMLGTQLLQFYVLARLYGSKMGLYPARQFSQKINRWLDFETGLLLGGSIFLLGILLSAYAVWQWQQAGFGPLDPSAVFRIIIPAGFCIALGMQIMVFGFLLYTIRQLQQPTLK
ncbi:glycosyltransferase family 2 protein [Phnomibacter sp. MR]|uniref:glycosyltransferase family 2 protein n=1 Tax=Phnomibacter sp. MR TaxID=3042318 RepID=UPI003A8054E7